MILAGRLRLRLAAALLAAACGMALPGCGYSLAGRGSFLPDYIRAIGIPTFANRTTLFNIETQMTEKVRAEFIGRGKYRIVPETQGVDAVLTGEVTGVSIVPLTVNPQQLASRYTITMTARVELRDTRENKTLWENPSLVFRQEYDAQGGASGAVDPSAFFGQDQNALDRMTTEFSRSIVSAILEAF
ncbi:MAG: LPS assembly lipoprotein LptE [Vicinamibacterales bacterium]